MTIHSNLSLNTNRFYQPRTHLKAQGKRRQLKSVQRSAKRCRDAMAIATRRDALFHA